MKTDAQVCDAYCWCLVGTRNVCLSLLQFPASLVGMQAVLLLHAHASSHLVRLVFDIARSVGHRRVLVIARSEDHRQERTRYENDL